VQGFEMSFVRVEFFSSRAPCRAPLLDVTQKNQIKRSREGKIHGRDDEDEDGNRGYKTRDARGWSHLCRHILSLRSRNAIIPREIIALTLVSNLVTVTSV